MTGSYGGNMIRWSFIVLRFYGVLGMKQIKLIYLFGFLFLFSGCENFYFSSGEVSKISQKTTHKIFSDLKQEPIVLTMPVYDKLYLFGNKNWNSKKETAGDIFLIFDCDSNSVYDWCYFNQNKYVTDGRVVEQNYNGKTTYYNFGYWADKIASIDGESAEINFIDCETFESNWSYETKGKYCLLTETKACPEDEKASTKEMFYAYNTETGQIDSFVSEIKQDKHVPNLLCDMQGRFWGSYSYDNTNFFFYIDYESNETKIVDSCTQIRKNQECFEPIYLDEKYVVYGNVGYENSENPINDYSSFSRLKIFSLEKNKFVNEIFIKRKECIYGVSIFPVGDSYKIMMSDGNCNIFFCDFSFEMNEIIPKDRPDLNFWYTGNVFPRGEKLYLVHSGFSENYLITYFDFSNNSQGPIVELNATSITSK